jgi:hypothetical protein
MFDEEEGGLSGKRDLYILGKKERVHRAITSTWHNFCAAK